MEPINYSLIRHYLLISLISAVHSSSCFPEYSPGSPEVSSFKCLYQYIAPIWKSDESKTKELELVWKPVTAKPEICSVSKPTNGPPDPIHKIQHKEITTSGSKTDSKDEKKLSSAFTSVGKKENSELVNSIAQAEGERHSSFDTYVNCKPDDGNCATLVWHLEIPITDKKFKQICSVVIAFFLILISWWWYYYIKESRKHVSEVMTRPQTVAPSTAEVSSNQRSSENDEETIPISNNDELALLTLSSMVYRHLQNLASEIKKSKPEENVEKFLTEDFLQQIATRIAQDDTMKLSFQKLLPAETLLQLGQLHYYQRSRNSGRSERVSSHLEGNETVSQHCTGKSKHQDVKVNIGVQVGGQEFKIPQSKREEKKENSPE